jgi:hypothetical protein
MVDKFTRFTIDVAIEATISIILKIITRMLLQSRFKTLVSIKRHSSICYEATTQTKHGQDTTLTCVTDKNLKK